MTTIQGVGRMSLEVGEGERFGALLGAHLERILTGAREKRSFNGGMLGQSELSELSNFKFHVD